jgi:S1-C subfamily serine protease
MSPGPRAHQRARYVLRCARPLKPATVERAGLKPGDLVTELDGTPVRDAADLQLMQVGEFAVSRPGGAVTVRAAMAEREPASHLAALRTQGLTENGPGDCVTSSNRLSIFS